MQQISEHCITWCRYHGGRRQSSDDSFHSPTFIPPSALYKPSIMKRYHRRRTCSHTSPRRSPTMVTLHDTAFVTCRWWNDGWTVKTVVTGLHDTGPRSPDRNWNVLDLQPLRQGYPLEFLFLQPNCRYSTGGLNSWATSISV